MKWFYYLIGLVIAPKLTSQRVAAGLRGWWRNVTDHFSTWMDMGSAQGRHHRVGDDVVSDFIRPRRDARRPYSGCHRASSRTGTRDKIAA